MTGLQIIVAASIIAALIWTVLDPRVGWAIAVLRIPFVIHQRSDLTLGDFYYGYLYQPGWETALPLILAVTGITALATSAALTVRRFADRREAERRVRAPFATLSLAGHNQTRRVIALTWSAQPS